ncbi:MORN repeat-containing protein 3-like [Tribolium madens]|uniref:MORN repeat-containing protein 3-like n=1 Tax=Tribolium madens TaxID=41895 RepID=UPI001CF735B9|nr:MORN repeat-containing protein 3-like [Tribolium madens]
MPFLKERKKISRSHELENNSKKNGLRHAVFNIVGDKYIGEWRNDFKTGKGALLTRHRQLYEGDFEDGFRHGFGVLAYLHENNFFLLEYRGNWRRGKMHGFGLRRYRDGGVYIGDWKNGKRHGYGLMWYPGGDFYAGDFVKDVRQGLGMLVRPDTSRYEGSWFGDMKHGKGRFLHLVTGQMQQGVWVRDVCVFCTFIDIRYRQSGIRPTKYPIHKIQLLDVEDLCATQEMKALQEIVHSCLSLHESLSSEINQVM